MTEPRGNNIIASALSLALVAVIGTALLAGTNRLTADRIAAEERRVMLEQLGAIIPERYDNELLDDHFIFSDELHFPRGQAVTAYRARLLGEPIAVVLKFAAVDGYNGNIDLLAGIRHDGSLLGVRVIAHRETPGLGDAIEVERSDWIRSFDDASLKNPGPAGWAVRRDGGDFDQFSGATITPRAVVEAVQLALQYFELRREALFEATAITGGKTGREAEQ
jgi:electron transport complex protein RnfG